MQVTEPPTLLLLLSGSLALTETWAGECGVETKWPLQEKPGDRLSGAKDSRGRRVSMAPRPDPLPRPRPVRTLPCPFRACSPLLSPLETPTRPLPSRTPSRPLLPYRSHSPRTWGPAPEGASGRVAAPPGPGGPLLEVLPHFGIASCPREGPLSICRLLGRHAVVRYNSDAENPRVESRAPWIEQEGPEYWVRQTKIATEHSQASRSNLQVIVGNHNHSELGESQALHSAAMSRGPPEFPGPRFRPEVRRSSDLSSVWEEPTRN